MQELDRDVARILEGMRRNDTPPLWAQPIEAARRSYDKGMRLLDLAPDSSVAACDQPLGAGLVVREYSPAQRAIVCRLLAARCGLRVFSAGYRLAPEHPFPAAVEDALQAYRWSLARLGENAARLVVAGDSAGGTLAAVVSLLARDAGLPAPAAQILVYPSTIGSRPSASKSRYAEGHFLTLSDVDWFYRHYTQGRELDHDPRFAPAAARDLRGQPRSLIIAAECDPLADDSRAYAEALAGAGNDVGLEVFPGMIHGFFNMGGVVPRARAAHDLAARFLSRALEPGA
jgi:acetyl esterase